MNPILKIIGFIILIMFGGCFDNSMYVNLESNELVSCSRKGFKKLSISNLKTPDLVFLETKGGRLVRVSLHDLDNNFWGIDTSPIIEPNSFYSIINSTYGDAAHFGLLIRTDSLGEVIETNRPNCDVYIDSLEKLR